MVAVNSHEVYIECSPGVFNRNLWRVELNGQSTVKETIISDFSCIILMSVYLIIQI